MLTATRLRDLLEYEAETGVFRWRKSPTPRIKAGQIAGSPDREGYIRISIDRRLHKASRLAFLYQTGDWPREEVDHRNGVAGDDRWSNLRETSRTLNALNRSKKANNTSGYKGVTRCGNKWKAQIQAHKRVHYLGLFASPAAAHAAYLVAAKRLHGEYARAA